MTGASYCCVYGCGNNQKHNSDKNFFSLPTDPERLATWLSLIHREDLLEKSKKKKLTQRVCSSHFGEENFKYIRNLNKDAVPNLNLPTFKSLEEGSLSLREDLLTSEQLERNSVQKNTCKIMDSSNLTSTDSFAASSTEAHLHENLRHDGDTSKNSHQTPQVNDTGKESGPLQQGCHCNGCSKVISGFRYICVQCTGVKLCSACEAAGLHGLHYVLRVPGHRPSEEIAHVLENIREELFKNFTVESIEIQIKEEPDPLGVVEGIYINTAVPADNKPLKEESRLANSETSTEETSIPNKKRRMEKNEFLNFKHENAPTHRTTQSISVVPFTNDIVDFVPDIKDIKVEVDDSEEARCEVFVHKDADPSSSESITMLTQMSDPETDQCATAIPLRGFAVSKFTVTAAGTSEVRARPMNIS